jgi:Rrf2 family protein
VQVTSRVDYAVRAVLELAAADGQRTTRDALADAQGIPPRYLESILMQLRQAGLVVGQRGSAGGYTLARAATEITVADVSRAVDGPLALVQGLRPEQVTYEGVSTHLGELWVGLRAALRAVMEAVTIADLLSGELPAKVKELTADPDAWRSGGDR